MIRLTNKCLHDLQCKMSDAKVDSNLSSALEAILHSKSYDKEGTLLQKVCHILVDSVNKSTSSTENVLHEDSSIISPEDKGEVLSGSKACESFVCDKLCENDIEKIVIYTFVRRYGWSEGVKMRITDSEIILMTGVQEVKSVTKSNKDNIDKRLDAIIRWLSQQPVCPELMKSYLKLVKEASSLPIVRNRSVAHVLSWLQHNTGNVSDDSTFRLINELLLVMLTDVWSAIRKVSSSHLGRILDTLSAANQESVWNRLVQVCYDESNSWQMTDGAVLGICAIVQHLHSNKGQTVSMPKAIPVFVKRDLMTVVFKVISHSQLTIRESAVKAVSAYMGLVETGECVEILAQAVSLLDGVGPSVDKCDGFVDAYLAEGLLNVCQSVIKILPLDSLLPNWEKYLSIFLHNLSHPASSVRQCASCIFKLLVQKSGENAALFCRVLHTLTHGWSPVLSENVNSGTRSLSWQGKEGRMFAFEIICSFLIKNHIKTMFSVRKQGNESLHPSGGNDNSQSPKVSPRVLGADSPLRSGTTQNTTTQSVIARLRSHDKTHRKRERSHYEQSTSHDYVPDKFGGEQNGLEHRCPSSRTLLKTVLYQTVECLSDSQWELHRIAQQVLPCLAEVIRWFDCSLLEHIWQTHLTSDTSLATYMSVFLLKESLYHCIRLEPLLQKSLEHTCKMPDLIESVRCILECVTRNTALYLPHAEQLLKRSCFDRLSVLAAEIIIMAHRLFEINTKQKHSQSSAVLEFWKHLFVFAHPNSRITRDLLDSPTTEFSSPYEGYLSPSSDVSVQFLVPLSSLTAVQESAPKHCYLAIKKLLSIYPYDAEDDGLFSCCLVKPEGDSQCARQVEKLLMKTVCCHLQIYLSCLPWTDMAAYLPLLMYNIGLIIDDTPMCKTLLRCLSSQCRRVVDRVLTEESSDRHFCLRCIYLTLREAAGVVAMKTLDSQLLQKVLSVYLVLCQAIKPSRHLKMILRGICVRLNKTTRHLESMDLSPRPDTDMSLLWQESPMLLSMAEGNGGEVDDEEEDIFAGGDLPSFYSECLSLNVSNSSGQFLTGRPRTVSTQSDAGEGGETEGNQENGEESDDWDSWSDEEQDDGAISEMFSVFLRNLKEFLGQDAGTIFDAEVGCLEADEKILVHRLTTSGF